AFIVICLADRTGLGNDVADEVLRQTVRAYFAVHRRRQRRVDAQISVIEPRGQQELAGRNATRLQLNPAITLAGGRGRGCERPRPRRIGRADAHFDTAAMKPRSAEADVPEGPVLTRACVVDCEVSVLKPQLFQVMAIEARFADPI